MPKPKVLITGASGLIASHILPRLADAFEVVLTDRTASTLQGHSIQALDITDYNAVLAAVQGVDAIIHLAIASSRHFVTDDALFERHQGGEYLRFNQATIEVNIRGTYNLFEAARTAGVRRVVFASSLTVFLGAPRYERISDDLPRRPVNFYAISKMFGEDLAAFFCNAHGQQIVSLRLGTPMPQPGNPKTEIWKNGVPPGQSTFMSFRDVADALIAAATCPWKGYTVATIVSNAPDCAYDLSAAREGIGWVPRDTFDEAGELIEG